MGTTGSLNSWLCCLGSNLIRTPDVSQLERQPASYLQSYSADPIEPVLAQARPVDATGRHRHPVLLLPLPSLDPKSSRP